MKKRVNLRTAIGSIALCLLTIGAVTVNAYQLPNRAISGTSDLKIKAQPALAAGGFDDFDDSPCKRFPKENAFDSFEKAFQTPEKVRCLNPTLTGKELSMKRLPAKFNTLVNLEVFSFGCLEQLETLPETIGNFRRMEELIIDNGNGCAMSVTLPRSIGKLENLRILRLYGAIASLPDTISDLQKLEVLDIARNGLTAVPAQIAGLTNLKTLRLEYNDLRSLPAFIGNFTNLQELSLDSNGRNVTLPASMTKIKKGLRISMGNNMLKLAQQASLRRRFPGIVFSFENEMDDSAANEEAAKPKAKAGTKRKQ